MRRFFRRISLKWLLVVSLLANLLIYLYIAFTKPGDARDLTLDNDYDTQQISRFKKGSLTVILREFEDFDNNVIESVSRVHAMLPQANIVVITDILPYPPIAIPKYAELLLLKPSIDIPLEKSKPELYLKTEFVMIIPDSCEVTSEAAVTKQMKLLQDQHEEVKMFGWPASSQNVDCLRLKALLRQWTLHYSQSDTLCDALDGNFVLLMRTDDLLKLSYPFARPLSRSLFVQTALRRWKVLLLNTVRFSGIVQLYEDPHLKWKQKVKQSERLKELYNLIGIKLVQHDGGKDEWYGCSKKSQRCFGTVVDDMPEFIQHGRWTPPCCLRALRETARHVFSLFERQGIRYWLEGGSLLGAARHNDIIPWDYDIDIGIYQSDILKSEQLLKCDFQPYVDDKGYTWERSKPDEAYFFRVQYSQTNHLHVDIFPFYSRNGTMTKDTWIKSHRQDTEFPERYLKPRVKVKFAGWEAYAPNNYKDFLELKFGAGVIDDPRYPDQSKASLNYPNHLH